MKQETLDYIASSIAIIGASSSFLFWLASRQIKEQLFHKFDRLSDHLNKRVENELIKIDFRLQRSEDINSLKASNLVGRIENIEVILKIQRKLSESYDKN